MSVILFSCLFVCFPPIFSNKRITRDKNRRISSFSRRHFTKYYNEHTWALLNSEYTSCKAYSTCIKFYFWITFKLVSNEKRVWCIFFLFFTKSDEFLITTDNFARGPTTTQLSEHLRVRTRESHWSAIDQSIINKTSVAKSSGDLGKRIRLQYQ